MWCYSWGALWTKRNPVLRASFLYHCEIKHLIFFFFIIYITTGGNSLMLHFYEHTICVNGITGASHTPASTHSFPLWRTSSLPACLPACLSIGITFRMLQPLSSQALNKQSSSFILYHSEACQTLNQQLCGSGYYFFLVTSLYTRVSSTDWPDV